MRKEHVPQWNDKGTYKEPTGGDGIRVPTIGVVEYIDITEATEPGSPDADNIRLFVTDDEGFSILSYKDSGGMVRKFVKDTVFIAYNDTVSTIAAARIVYASGSTGSVPNIGLAKADSSATMPAIGVTIETIAAGAYGRVMQAGLLEDVNTLALSSGDILYVSAATAGVPTTTAPAYPNLRQEIGTVLVDSATVGSIQIVARTAFDDSLVSVSAVLTSVLAENDAIKLDPALSADGKYNGITTTGTAGATLAFGDCVYQAAADGRWELAKADAAATSDGKLGMCILAAAGDGSATDILLIGTIRADTAFPSFSVRRPVFISAATAGDLTSTAPTGTTNYVVRIVGYANTADELFFCPDNTYIELA